MGLADDLNRALHDNLKCHVAWLPISNTFDLGDYGVIANGVFTKVGNVRELGATFEVDESPAAKLDFASADTRTTHLVASAEVDIIPEGAIDAKTKLSFPRATSFLLRAADVRLRAVRTVGTLLSTIAKHKDWRVSYKLVWQTWVARNAALLSTRTAGTEVTVTGDVPALRRFHLGDVSADLRLASNQELGLSLVGASGVIGLGLVKLRFLVGGPSFLAGRGTDFDPVAPGTALPDSDV
jgi:hypothetical protein